MWKNLEELTQKNQEFNSEKLEKYNNLLKEKE